MVLNFSDIILTSFFVCFFKHLEKPPPPKHLRVMNVHTRYIVFAWDQPKHGSFYQILNYTIERKTSASESFTAVKTLSYDQTRMTLKDLEPSTEYTIRLSSNNRYGRSDGVLLTKGTLPGKCYRFTESSSITMEVLLRLDCEKPLYSWKIRGEESKTSCERHCERDV